MNTNIEDITFVVKLASAPAARRAFTTEGCCAAAKSSAVQPSYTYNSKLLY